MTTKDIFEQMASKYDTEERIKDSEVVANEIRHRLSDNNLQRKQALDYGCGTGQVGFQLLDLFDSMTFVDASPQMVELVERKITMNGITNASAQCHDFINDALPDIKVDYIFLSRVLIHVKDYLLLLERLSHLLRSDGFIVIVDFDKNEKIETDKVHHGFEQMELRLMLEQMGFISTDSYTFYRREKMFVNQDASLFILVARK